ncbi:MAG TPA: DUF5916 domain-containing protein [Kofleriaceae bacterium]
MAGAPRIAAVMAVMAATAVLVPVRGHAEDAAEPPRPRMVAVRTSAAPNIDGDVGDAAWQQAVPTTAFTQKFPNEAQAPSEPTELRVLYDDAALYVAFDCVQLGTPVKGRLARRDRQVESDWIQVAIDDGASTYEFSVNAAGVLGDGVRFNDTDYAAQWDGVWDAQVRQHDRGWSAELRIPLRIFRDSVGIRDWGFQARRYISGRQETVEWAFIPRTMAGEVSHYGRLSGIAGVQRSNPLELLPYVAAGLDWSDMTRDRRAFGDLGSSGAVGLDLRWRIAQHLTLDASVNPDFAQVEADQLVLNLTTFETFVPEKRPFFINGLDLFRVPRMELFPTPQTLFYTRRIGSVPQVPDIGDGGAGVAAAPTPSTIYAAAKFNGQLGGGVTAGVVSAVTGRNDLAITAPGTPAMPTAVTRDYLADPLALANVARIKVAVGSGSSVGVLATALQRFEPDGAYPMVMQPDGSQRQQCPDGSSMPRGERCFHDAYVAGLDGSWRSGSGSYTIAGQALASLIEHGPARTMLDGTVIHPGDAGAEGRLYLAKEGGQWRGSVETDVTGRRVDYNDLGYLQRANHLRVVPYLAYRIVDPFWEIAEMEAYAFVNRRQNLDGFTLLQGYYLGNKIRFKNFWSVIVEAARYTERGEDRQVGDGTALQRLPATGLDVTVNTDPRRQLAASVFTETLVTSRGKSFELDGELTYLPLPRLELQLLPQLMFRYGDPRFVTGSREDGEYVFGDLDAQSVSATLRTSYTFTNRLTLQLFGQLLLVAEHYSDFRSLQVDPAARRPVVRPDRLTPVAAPAADPDNEETNLNLSAVLRWEFRPGSTLFLVYSRFQAPALTPDRDARLDLGALRAGPAEDAIRLKLSYYWN